MCSKGRVLWDLIGTWVYRGQRDEGEPKESKKENLVAEMGRWTICRDVKNG